MENLSFELTFTNKEEIYLYDLSFLLTDLDIL